MIAVPAISIRFNRKFSCSWMKFNVIMISILLKIVQNDSVFFPLRFLIQKQGERVSPYSIFQYNTIYCAIIKLKFALVSPPGEIYKLTLQCRTIQYTCIIIRMLLPPSSPPSTDNFEYISCKKSWYEVLEKSMFLRF